MTENIATVTGRLHMPLTVLERAMTLVRLCDGRLVIYSAVWSDDLRELESFGKPAFLIVPNHQHRTDARAFKQRYPDLVVVAPPGAKQAVEAVVPVDTTAPDFGDRRVQFVEVAGTRGMEGALEVEDDNGLSIVVTDVIGNLPHAHGLVLRALGFAGHKPRIPRAFRIALVKDKPGLRRQLEAWARRPVQRVIMAHGTPITAQPRQALMEMAESLG